MNAVATFAAETLGFTVRKISGEFSRDRDPVVDVSHLFPDAGKMPEVRDHLYRKVNMINPTMTDEVRHIAIELVGESGPVEIPVRHVQESGGKMTVSGIRHSVGSLHESVLSGRHTKKEWREWRSLVLGRNAIDVTGFFR